jgi:hypothetical protein
MPEYADKSHVRVSSVVRWLAKPAPPSVVMSSVPWKHADVEEEEGVRYDCEAPPRTRSSLDVQSDEVQGLLQKK